MEEGAERFRMSHAALVAAVQQIDEAHEREVASLRHQVADLQKTVAGLLAKTSVESSEAVPEELTISPKLVLKTKVSFAGTFPRLGKPVKVVAGDEPQAMDLFEESVPTASTETVLHEDPEDVLSNKVSELPEQTLVRASSMILMRSESMTKSRFSWWSSHRGTWLKSSFDAVYGDELRELGRRLLSSLYTEILMWLLVVLNCTTLALAANGSVTSHEITSTSSATSHKRQLMEIGDQHQRAVFGAECALTFLFVLEIGLRFWAFGRRAFGFQSVDTIFTLVDALVVLVTNVISVWILAPAGVSFLYTENGGWIIRLIMLLRVVRMARLFRVAPHIPACNDITAFMQGFAGSCFTFLWSILIILAATAFFAIFAVITITPKLEEFRSSLDVADVVAAAELDMLLEDFGSVSTSMYTLGEILTVDGFHADTLKGLKHWIWWAWFFLFSYKAVMDLLCLNLVTALVVDNALANSRMAEERAQAAKEQAKKEEMDQLNNLFLLMDENGDGTLTWEEFKQAMMDPKVSSAWKTLEFRPDEAKEVFRLLDKGDGEIKIEQFFDGLKKMRGVAQSRDVFRITRVFEEVLSSLQKLMTYIPQELKKPLPRSHTG